MPSRDDDVQGSSTMKPKAMARRTAELLHGADVAAVISDGPSRHPPQPVRQRAAGRDGRAATASSAGITSEPQHALLPPSGACLRSIFPRVNRADQKPLPPLPAAGTARVHRGHGFRSQVRILDRDHNPRRPRPPTAASSIVSRLKQLRLLREAEPKRHACTPIPNAPAQRSPVMSGSCRAADVAVIAPGRRAVCLRPASPHHVRRPAPDRKKPCLPYLFNLVDIGAEKTIRFCPIPATILPNIVAGADGNVLMTFDSAAGPT